MKTLQELAAIRDKMKSTVATRENDASSARVVVGMATCGIAAGARPVLTKFAEAVEANGLQSKYTVLQTGCVGICQYEPVVEVFEPGKEKITYVNMSADKVDRIIKEHFIGGHPVTEYTIGAAVPTK